MKKLKLLLVAVLIFFFNAFSSEAETFFFNFQKDQIFKINAWTYEEIYKNDIFIKRSKTKTTGVLKIIDFDGHRALHRGIYTEYGYNELDENYVIVNQYETEFYRDKSGYYDIDRRFFMPVVRNVPVFPEKDITIGDQWTAKAFEAHDFRKAYGISNPVIFPAAVSYQYLGNEKIENKNISKFSINYVINYTMRYSTTTGALNPLPYRIIGYFNQLFLWNRDLNLPDSYRENFDFIIIMSNGEIIEYVGKSHGNVQVKQPVNQETEISKIREQLRKIPDVKVAKSSEGIVINIGEILFKFDSDELVPEYSSTIENIIEVLKDYPDRKIRIVGHTDSSGTENYNLSLSLRRAKRVAEELINKSPSLENRITYMGMGEKMPIAPNDTEEGRKRNRRVEIIIVNPAREPKN